MKNQVNTKMVSSPLVEPKYQFDIIPDAMAEDKPRSIRFPPWLWDAIDRDAQNANRSAVKQMETILSAYYGKPANEHINERVSEMVGPKTKPRKTEKLPIKEPVR